jgi:phosphoglycerate dehydrogenase-like enzyme
VVLGRDLALAPLAAVRELTFGLMLACLRHIPTLSAAIHDSPAWPASTGRLLSGRRLGILGLGRHGKNIATIAKAFGMEVVAWNRGKPREEEDGIPRLGLDDLLASADVVTVHLRLSDESKGLLGARAFGQMKRGAILINTARGAIVQERALIDALKSGQISAAGLDVFEEEPLAPHSELRMMSNVVLTPHIGWQVEEVFFEFAAVAASQLKNHIDSKQ